MPKPRSPSFESARLCELCLHQGVDSPATTTESDEWGNELVVCEDHAYALAANKPEAADDRAYDDDHRSGD